MMRINLRQTKPMKRYLVYTTDDLRAGPFDATHYFVPTPHENRYLTAPVEKVGLASRHLRPPLNAQLDPAQGGNDDDERDDLDDAERRDRAVAATLLPHGQADGSKHVGARTDQEDRGAELAHGQHEDVDPAGQQDRRDQRQHDASEHLPEAGARDLRRLLELAMDLGDPARREAHAVGQVQGHVGDEQDPDRVVDRDRQHEIGDQDAGTHDHAR